MNAMLRSCGLAALLALSAVAEPPAQSAAPTPAPAVQSSKKAAAPDKITSSDDAPAPKVVTPAAVKPALLKAPGLVEQKASPAVMPPAKPGYPDEQKQVDKPVTKPAAATPPPSKIVETAPAAKPAAATPAPTKVVESAPATRPAAATPPPSKIVETAPAAKPAAAAPVPTKVVESAPATRPAAATPPPSKIVETAPAAKPAAATPAPAKVVETAPAGKPAAATPPASKIVETAPAARPAAATPAASKIVETAPAAKPAAATPAPAKVVETAPAAKPAAATPAPAKMTETAPATKPAATTTRGTNAAAPMLTENLVFPQAKTELRRLMVGNQAGIVKVLGPNREGVSYVRGIDDKNIARYCDDACGSIFCALGVSHDKLNKVAEELMINYSTLPRKEAVAFLSAIAASSHLTAEMDAKTEEFLVKVMETDKDVHARRQAVLALAVKQNVCSNTTDRVLGLFEHSENLWETFPVQQYFEYHALQVKRLTNFTQLRERIAAVKSLYTPAILQALDGGKPVSAIP